MEFNKHIIIPQIGVLLMFYFQLTSTDEVLHYRVEDKPFPAPLLIHHREVNCSLNDHDPGKFPAFTWTCRDMRVDGMRMAYGYNPSITKDNKCQETNGRDELAEVCRRMMHAIGASYTLWVAFKRNLQKWLCLIKACGPSHDQLNIDKIDGNVRMFVWTKVTNATCNFINEKRVFLNMTGPNIYEWELMKPGYGWIDTLRCTAVP